MKITKKVLAAGLALGMLVTVGAGCAAPKKVMFKQEFVQDRSVRHIRNPNTGEYLLQICEYDDVGKSQSCTESPILVEQETETLL